MSSYHHLPTQTRSNTMTTPGFDINQLLQQAKNCWLKPPEVMFFLKNPDSYGFTSEVPQNPTSGSIYLYDKTIFRFFRKDGHIWRKKKNGRTVGEGHERLKVANVEALNCYYAHGEENPNFQRRSYWMLDPMFEHIVLVHYREVQGRGRSVSTLVSSCWPSVPGPGISTGQNQDQSSFTPPGSSDISSGLLIMDNGKNLMDENQRSKDSEVVEFGQRSDGDDLSALPSGLEYRENYQYFSENAGLLDQFDCFFQPNSGENIAECNESSIWREVSEQCLDTSWLGSQSNVFSTLEQNEGGTYLNQAELVQRLSGDGSNTKENMKDFHRTCDDDLEFLLFGATLGSDDIVGPTSNARNQEVEIYKISTHSSGTGTHEVVSYHGDQVNQSQVSLGEYSSLPLVQGRRFTIQEISPEWGYATDSTKVIITGIFNCDPSKCAWSCMFGDTEVPVEIIQEGVLRCQAPPQISGKVTLCITSGNHESCSELREFEYRIKPSMTDNCSSQQSNTTRSTEELLLLVQFAQMLLHKEDNGESVVDLFRISKFDEDPWGRVTEALSKGSKTPLHAMDCVVLELLKDKLEQWLSSKYKEDKISGCCLSKKEQCIIHTVAGLGFEWALDPILNSGVGVNYRDVYGWTALHWAARYGRERMVAALIAAGASAAAVTHPTSQDPVGKTPGSIADASGHKGLAGYLSEVALTSHLSSLSLEECNISIGFAAMEAERTVESITDGSLSFTEDQLALKDSLAAVRNATQAAKRIESAFHARSFRMRLQREAVAACDEYGLTLNDIRALSAAAHLTSPNFHEHILNKAALSIQKKYRGWKEQQNYLSLRQKIVTIQACMRGYKVRKEYKVILWAVGILDKVVLRWHRKRAGLRVSEPLSESDDDIDYEEVLKVFRKQKVYGAIDEALSRVLSMVKSPEARQQYRRMRESYWKAKADLLGKGSDGTSICHGIGENNSMDE